MQVFDRRAKLLQRERAAASPEADSYDFLKEEVAELLHCAALRCTALHCTALQSINQSINHVYCQQPNRIFKDKMPLIVANYRTKRHRYMGHGYMRHKLLILGKARVINNGTKYGPQ
jgi:hypothetical protein